MDRQFYDRMYQPRPGKVRVVLDTDMGNSIDDQFALAWLLKSPERIQLEAIYAEPFSHEVFTRADGSGKVRDYINEITLGAGTPEEGMEASYREILKIGALCGVNLESRAYRGSPRFLARENEPVLSDAATDLIRRAKASDEPLYVIAIGAITNIASALMLEPSIASRLVLVWLAAEPLHFPQTFEFNLSEDEMASRFVFDCGVPMVLVPSMTVASHLTVSEAEVGAYLAGKNPVCDYLSAMMRELFPKEPETLEKQIIYNRVSCLKGLDEMDDEWSARFPTAHVVASRIIWDIAAAAYVMNPTWCPAALHPSPVLEPGSRWGKENPSRHPIQVCSYVFRDCIMGDLFYKLAQ